MALMANKSAMAEASRAFNAFSGLMPGPCKRPLATKFRSRACRLRPRALLPLGWILVREVDPPLSQSVWGTSPMWRDRARIVRSRPRRGAGSRGLARSRRMRRHYCLAPLIAPPASRNGAGAAIARPGIKPFVNHAVPRSPGRIRRMARRRTFDALSEAQLAADRLEPRRGAGMASLPAGPAQPVGDLLDAIAHVAEAAIGERSFLHVAPGEPSAPTSRPEGLFCLARRKPASRHDAERAPPRAGGPAGPLPRRHGSRFESASRRAPSTDEHERHRDERQRHMRAATSGAPVRAAMIFTSASRRGRRSRSPGSGWSEDRREPKPRAKVRVRLQARASVIIRLTWSALSRRAATRRPERGVVAHSMPPGWG